MHLTVKKSEKGLDVLVYVKDSDVKGYKVLNEVFERRIHDIRKLFLFCQNQFNCPTARRDFAQKAKSRGGTLVTRAYIKESTYS